MRRNYSLHKDELADPDASLAQVYYDTVVHDPKVLRFVADMVGADEYLPKIKDGWTDVDVIIATPDMMVTVGKLGKVLGPRGLMPNPKLGTVTNDVAKAVKDAKGGQIEFRAEKEGVVHAGIGKASFDEKALVENVSTFINAITKAKPTGVKGTYMKGISISSTMGPGVKIDMSSSAS